MAETLHDAILKGERAELALKAIEETAAELEEQCLVTFRGSDVHDTAGHQACLFYLRVLDDIRDRLRSVIGTGKAAQRELVRPEFKVL